MVDPEGDYLFTSTGGVANMEDKFADNSLKIFIKYKSAPLLDFKIEKSEKIGDFKTRLEDALKISLEPNYDTSVLRLIHNGKELLNGSTFEESGVKECDWLLLLKCPEVSAKNLKFGKAVAAAFEASTPKNTGEDAEIAEAIRRLNSDSEMKRIAEIMVALNKDIFSLEAGCPYHDLRVMPARSADITLSRLLDSLKISSSLNYRISTLKRWLSEIVPNELPKTAASQHSNLRLNIYYRITEVQRTINELALLAEATAGNTPNNEPERQLNLAAILGRSGENDPTAGPSLQQTSILIPSNWTADEDYNPIDEAVARRMFSGEQLLPERFYGEELAQLNDMGFHDNLANIQALQLANGIVEDAVEFLFEHFQRY